MSADLPLLLPDWPAPKGVHACVTSRLGGVSKAPWDSLNLGSHVGDDPEAVAENRRRLANHLGLAGNWPWLNQVHGTLVAEHGQGSAPGQTADACWTQQVRQPCVVLTADCLPVLFASLDGRTVAAAHAGWRGLLHGVLESTVAALPVRPDQLLAWLCPAIGPEAFEVGPEVRSAYVALSPDDGAAFSPSTAGRFKANLAALARLRLTRLGVTDIYGGGLCTHSDATRYFSHRRDAAALGNTGRFASLIWRDA